LPRVQGSGTKTVTGPTANVTGSMTFNLGDMNDIFNLRDTNNEVFVNGADGNDTINISAQRPGQHREPLDHQGDVTVNGGAGTNSLVVSDQGASSGNAKCADPQQHHHWLADQATPRQSPTQVLRRCASLAPVTRP